jgi:hypothetical protein
MSGGPDVGAARPSIGGIGRPRPRPYRYRYLNVAAIDDFWRQPSNSRHLRPLAGASQGYRPPTNASRCERALLLSSGHE